jgi:hypothetical protein
MYPCNNLLILCFKGYLVPEDDFANFPSEDEEASSDEGKFYSIFNQIT